MPLQMAFGITVRDVRAVLAKHADKIVGQSEMTADAFAASLYYSFSEEEMDTIALSAMEAFLDDVGNLIGGVSGHADIGKAVQQLHLEYAHGEIRHGFTVSFGWTLG